MGWRIAVSFQSREFIAEALRLDHLPIVCFINRFMDT
jgi:hypothetical protein